MTYSEDFLAGRGDPSGPGYVKFLEEKCEVILHTTPGDATLHDVTLTPPFPYASAYVKCNADHQQNPQRLLPEHTRLFFNACSLRHTDFSYELGLPAYSRFLNCDLTRAKFTRTAPRLSVFVHCNLAGADFAATNLDTVVFIDCNLTGTNLIRASLWAAAFVGCNTQDAYMRGSLVVPGALELPGYKEVYFPRPARPDGMAPLILDIPWLAARTSARGCPEGLATSLAGEHPQRSPQELLALCNAAATRLPSSSSVTY